MLGIGALLIAAILVTGWWVLSGRHVHRIAELRSAPGVTVWTFQKGPKWLPKNVRDQLPRVLKVEVSDPATRIPSLQNLRYLDRVEIKIATLEADSVIDLRGCGLLETVNLQVDSPPPSASLLLHGCGELEDLEVRGISSNQISGWEDLESLMHLQAYHGSEMADFPEIANPQALLSLGLDRSTRAKSIPWETLTALGHLDFFRFEQPGTIDLRSLNLHTVNVVEPAEGLCLLLPKGCDRIWLRGSQVIFKERIDSRERCETLLIIGPLPSSLKEIMPPSAEPRIPKLIFAEIEPLELFLVSRGKSGEMTLKPIQK